MDIRFLPAKIEQIPDLLRLCRAAAKAAPGAGWNAAYPDRAILEADIAAGALYTIRLGEETLGMLSMGKPEPELDALSWPTPAEKPCEFARFCFRPRWQGRGLGKAVLQAAFAHCSALGYDAVRILVNRENHRALALYQKVGFVSCGRLRAWELDFDCYEYTGKT